MTDREDEKKRRYELMLSKINNNRTGQSMLDSRTGTTAIQNNTVINGTLPTEQFYRQTLNSGYNESRGNGSSAAPQVTGSASTPSIVGLSGMSGYAPSNTSTVFRLPQTTTSYRNWQQYKDRIDFAIRLMCQCEDQDRVRSVVRLLETAVSVLLNHEKTDPQMEINIVCNKFKDKYYGGRIPKHISSVSSVISEQNQFDPYKNNNPVTRNNIHTASSIMMDMSAGRIQKPFSSTSSITSERHQLDPYNPRVVLDNNFGSQRNQLDRTNYTNTLNSTNLGISTNHRPELAQQGGLTNAAIEESSLSLFSESTLAQRRDENAIRRHQPDITVSESISRPQPTATKAVLQKVNSSRMKTKPPLTSIFENKLVSNVQQTAAAQTSIQNLNKKYETVDQRVKTVTRTGRTIKSPIQFWKGNESQMNDTVVRRARKLDAAKENVDLNDSMMLRNRKIVDKNLQLLKNPKKGSTILSPLNSISENVNINIVNKKNKSQKENPKKSVSKKEKKDDSCLPQKPTKKQNSKKQSTESNIPKEKLSKTKLTEEKAMKKPVQQKRKSKEINEQNTKKKKVEDESIEDFGGDISSDDELFEGAFSRKITKPILQNVISPTSGLLSAKKLGGVPLSKETPPCKSLGQIMNTTTVSAASSTLKGAPVAKRNKVVKRVEKIVEKGKKDRNKPQTNKNTKKKQDVLLPSYTTVTPLTVANFSMALGHEDESDDNSSFTEEEEDEDLM